MVPTLVVVLSRRFLTCLTSAAVAAGLAGGLATGASASSRTLPITASLPSSDPTMVQDQPRAILSLGSSTAITAVRVTLRRGSRTYGSGSMPGRLAKGKTAVALNLVASPRLSAGTYQLSVSGRRSGARRTTTRDVRLTTPTLPVRAAPQSTLTGDNAGGVRLVLRSVAGRKISQVRATLLNRSGATVATANVTDSFTGQSVVDLPIAGTLPAGTYRLRLTGRASGASSSQRVEQPLTFASGGTGGSPAVSPNDGLTQQKVVVDWSGGKFSGREVGGFVAPGIGHGEILCRPDAQWIRFFPNEQSREVAMMNWTYKDWGGDHEKSLREALHTSGTGPDFREGFNKFSPTEKHSTGQYDGIISDRGVIGGAGGDSLAPPTTLHLTWEWDMSKTGGERCHVEATFTTQASGSDTPLARSVQVGWRGDANAAGRDGASVDVPGLGNVALRCEATPSGNRTLTIDTPAGATVTTREGSDDSAVPQTVGPVAVQLPNNGMVSIAFEGGQTLMASSRWKANDPDGSQNFCLIAAQVLQP